MSVGAGAAAAAAAAAEMQRQEEEEMTPYSSKDLDEGWEFKILRSNFRAFRNQERLRAVLEEEKRGGWTLVEKFDDQRIRLKRPAGAKASQGELADGYDPYRTTVGMAQGALVMADPGVRRGRRVQSRAGRLYPGVALSRFPCRRPRDVTALPLSCVAADAILESHNTQRPTRPNRESHHDATIKPHPRSKLSVLACSSSPPAAGTISRRSRSSRLVPHSARKLKTCATSKPSSPRAARPPTARSTPPTTSLCRPTPTAPPSATSARWRSSIASTFTRQSTARSPKPTKSSWK